ncbi:SIMPL domain-containing protein [uncultured Paraglaciecola sp.]|uniref:SIMPL domain-containing protein n=1 Tax=uncultured Paraglaciecola sp. TaxID=1765024 RepID=UPI0025941CD0|nr:SIMPL domain-containing protein [uncultured Paraglaciecola sp.]
MRIITLVLFLTCISQSHAKQSHSSVDLTRQIEVTGVGQVFSIPNRFSFSLSLEEKGNSAADLNGVMTEKSTRVINALLKVGVNKKSLQALQVRFNPWVVYNNQTREQKGFILTRTINVTVDDLQVYEKAIDEVLKLGITSISNFNYSNSESEVHYQASLRQALLSAKARAEDMVKSLDLKLGKVISISEQSAGQAMPVQMRMREAKSSSSYQPGEMTTETQVRVIFSIE